MQRPLSFAVAALGLLTAFAGAQTSVQILHASDLEGGVDAITDAPNFAAVVRFLEDDAANSSIPSILLSAGDNYIPGPFFNAAAQSSLRSVLQNTLFPGRTTDIREGEGRIDISIMNLLGFDAAAIGNHEFDAGAGFLAALISPDIRGATPAQVRWLGTQFPYLSSNLDFSGEPALQARFTTSLLPNTDFRSPINDLNRAANAPKIARATLVTRGSQTFAVVGATTQLLDSITSNGGVSVIGPSVNDMPALAALIQPEIDAIRNLGVDKIILVTHLQQFALEQALTPLLRGVDVVIAGGSDTISADPQDRLRAGDAIGQPYPFVTNNADGEPAVIVSTAGQYGYVGRLVVAFDAAGVLIPGSVDPNVSGAFATDARGVVDLYGTVDPFATPGVPADVKALTDAVRGIVTARDGNIFGRADEFLEGRREAVRTEETNLGSLTADANLFVAMQYDPSVLVSHKNGGGIRDAIGTVDAMTGTTGPTAANPLSGKMAGEISQLDIENSLRFNNGLTLLTLTRDQLKQVLEHAVAATGPGSTPGQFGQFGGVSFSFDPSRTPGDRVRSASLTRIGMTAPIFVIDGAIHGTTPIRIVTLNFLADGGDGYPFPAFIAANPGFANRVDLVGAPGIPAGVASFAADGSEQDALAEFLAAAFSATPFARADVAVGDDQRIQQIGTRPGFAVDLSDPSRAVFAVSGGTGAVNLALLALATQAAELEFDLGLLGSYTVGVLGVATPFAFTGANGTAAVSLQVPPGFRADLTGQIVLIDPFGATGIEFRTSESTTFSVR